MKNSKVIVIVEDDELIARIYVTKFKSAGFEVHRAYNGEEGLKLISEIRPNIVLMDVNLPQKSGLDVLASMRLNSVIKNIPVVMLTNSSNMEDVARAHNLGVHEYLIKAHCLPSEVVAKVCAHIEC